MFTLPIYQVDAFAGKLFGGNPAAVIPLTSWLPAELMQQIAMENNLAETVFFVPKDGDFEIRWFTPVLEINLCGHATLASAYVLFHLLGYDRETIRFHSQSGILEVKQEGEVLWMDFPAWMPQRLDSWDSSLASILGIDVIEEAHRYRDLMVVVRDEETVRKASPDFGRLKQLGDKIILTSPGNEVDFVSRFFAPTAGIDEDPVTGSAHAQLIPFWGERLGKMRMQARQLSARGGELEVEYRGDRVGMGGTGVFYLKGEIYLPD